MAINKGGHLSGMIGPVVLYYRNGKEIIKSKGRKVKQTDPTKASAKSFGKIKGISSWLRAGLSRVLPSYLSMPVMYAMDRAVGNWYRHQLPALTASSTGFAHFVSLQLNSEASPSPLTFLGAEPEVEWNNAEEIAVQLPSIDTASVVLPKGATAMAFTLVVTGSGISDPRDSRHAKMLRVEKEITPAGVDASTLLLGFKQAADSLYLAFLQIAYKVGITWLEEDRWKPLLLVGSCYRSKESE